MRISDWSSDVCSSDLVVKIVEGVRTSQRFFQANPLRIFKIVLGVIGIGFTVVQVVDDELMQMPTLPPHGPEQGHVQFTQGNVGRHQNRSVDQRSAVTQFNAQRSEEHTSELQSLMRISYAVFCLKKKKPKKLERDIDTRPTNKH